MFLKEGRSSSRNQNRKNKRDVSSPMTENPLLELATPQRKPVAWHCINLLLHCFVKVLYNLAYCFSPARL